MINLPEILEQELEEAFEVKNKRSLHRYVVLLTDNIIQKSDYRQNNSELKSEIKVLAETMREGFRAFDKRCEAVDKRFEDLYRYMDNRFEDMNNRFADMNSHFNNLNKRFNMMFSFMSVGISIIILLTVIFKFLQ